MPDYRRCRRPGACYFFTVALLQRHPNDLLVRHVGALRTAVREVKRRWPFYIDGWVVLPDHLHCVWTLPPGDADFSVRWRLIKAGFAKRLPRTEWRSVVRQARGERGVWQRRFWEHLIRDERITPLISITFITTRSSTGTSRVCVIGRIRVSGGAWSRAGIRSIGRVAAMNRCESGVLGSSGIDHAAQCAALLRPTAFH